MMWGHGWNGLMMGGWIIGGLLMLLFWGAVIGVIVWIVRELSRPRAGRSDQVNAPPVQYDDRALQIAQERYARGEISREQYEEIRQTLRA
jgi:putative membrane protein